MRLNLNLEELRKLTTQATFLVNGDSQERQYGALVTANFPRCEEFWRHFVISTTRRIEDMDGRLGEYIYYRDGIDSKLMEIASAHYSIFMHLAYAHFHLEHPTPSSLENIYTHLSTVCDLAETVIEKWHLVRLRCRGEQSKVLQCLSREEFMNLAGEWYGDNYANAYTYYYSKGKSLSIDVPKGKNLLKEYFGKSNTRLEYARLSNLIRPYRNAIVHDIKLCVLISSDGKIFIPKLEEIKNYRTWKAVQDVANNSEVLSSDFMEISQQLQKSIHGLENCLNALWEKLISDFIDEFYSPDRDTLRIMYGIEATKESGVYSIGKSVDTPLLDIPYIGASATYPRLDEWKYNSSAITTSGSASATITDDKTPQ